MRELSAIEFLSSLRTLGVRLSIKDDKLSCTAPKGVLTAPLAAELKERKSEIMALLSQNSAEQAPAITHLCKAEYEPTAGQRQLWFLDRLDPESSAYNISLAVRLIGKLNRSALLQSIQNIVARHEVLRTAIAEKDGEPVAILQDCNCEIEEIPVSELPSDERESAMRAILRREGRRRFDLSSAPLVRAFIIALHDEEHVLGVVLHHIAADGYSLKVFFEELIALYPAIAEGTPSPLTDLPVQYSDYAVWQEKYFEKNPLSSDLRYWKEKLREPLSVTELPADRPRPTNPSQNGGRSLQFLPGEVLEEVRRFSLSSSTTPFVVLLSAFYLLLHRYTRQADLTVGSASSGRGRSETEALIGLFIRNLVLRVNVEDDPSVRDLMGRARETVLGAFAHENLSLERIVEAVHPQRDVNRGPLFQTMFIYQSQARSFPDLPGLKSEVIIEDTGYARFDLTIEAAEVENQLILSWEYSTDLFDSTTIQRLQQHYQGLLCNMMADPGCLLSKVPFMTEEERSELVHCLSSRKDFSRNECVHEWIERQCSATPDAIAVRFRDEALTYRELDQRATHLAFRLRALGVGPEVLVGVLLERSVNLVVGLLAVLKAGGAYVPLDPCFPADRLTFMLEDSQAAVLVTEESLLASAPACKCSVFCVDRVQYTESARIEKKQSRVTPNNRAYVLYTSGSTGTPKGVEIQHGSLTNFLASMQREPGMAQFDRLLAVTTPSFDIAGLELYLPLVSGACLVIAPKSATTDGVALSRMIETEKITVMQATPVTWRMLLETGWRGSPGLTILCGGEELSRELANRLLATGSTVWNLYGPTETTVWSTLHRVTAGEGSVPIGRPITNTQLYVLDDHLQPVPWGAVGELFIAGDGVARGYLNRPELTKARFPSNPFDPPARMYRTGDLVRLIYPGILEYLGRADTQIKLRGFRIELGEIENILERQPGVRQAVVVVREDTPGDQRLTAYILPESRSSANGESLREAIGQKLPEYMLPAAWVFLDEFPLTPNRKVNRKALPSPTSNQVLSSRYTAPRTESEKQIAAIWQKLLNQPSVGVTENFFDLGGHSLLVIRLQAQLRQHLGWEPSLVELFQYPTVASIAGLMDAQNSEARMAAAVSGD